MQFLTIFTFIYSYPVIGIKKEMHFSISHILEEAQTGFEPVDTGVADHCLTTWLLRHLI